MVHTEPMEEEKNKKTDLNFLLKSVSLVSYPLTLPLSPQGRGTG
jgi:hypothetical protein